MCALGVRDAYLTGLKSRSCQQLPGVVLASLCGAYPLTLPSELNGIGQVFTTWVLAACVGLIHIGVEIAAMRLPG